MSGPRELDALGLLCPLPIARSRQALDRMAPGEVLVLWSDDEEILRDLPAFCEGSGHRLLSLREATSPAGGRAWRGEIRRA